MTEIDYRFRLRRRTAASWTSLNEVLLDSEIGIESDTVWPIGGGRKYKVGDGVTAWNSLDYANPDAGLTLVAGDGINIDDSDPANPIISSSLAAVALSGRVANYAALPTGLTSGNAGKAYLNDADGLIYVWNGTAFPSSGLGYAGGAGAGNQTALAAAIMSYSPKVYYKCDETSGSTLNDSSGNGMHLTLQGSNFLNQFELVKGGGSFASSTSATAANGAKRTGTAGITVPVNYDYTEVVVCMIITSTNSPIIVFDLIATGETAVTNTQARIQLLNVVTGTFMSGAFWETGAGVNIQTNGPVVPNGLPFMAAIRKTSATKTLDFFINGKLVYSDTYTTEATSGTSCDTYLGTTASGSGVAYSILSNFAFIPSALTNAQIKAIAKAGGFG